MKECRQFTVKVTEGNAFQLLLPLRTARWEENNLVVEDIDIMALQVESVTVDGNPWTNYQLEQQGPMLTIPATMPLGAHDVIVTATYYGVEVQAAYYECFTIVRWSYESNVGNFIPDSPMIGEAAYIYVGITNDAELETLKQQLRDQIIAYKQAEEEAIASKIEFDNKAEKLDDVAQQSTSLQITDKLDNLNIESEDARMVAQFFGLPAALPDGYEFMTPEEVCSELEDIMTSMDITLTQQQAQEITQQTLTQQ